MSCLIKNIPNSAKVLYGTGNKGLFFPLVPICETVPQPDAPPPEECYLAVELGNLTRNVCNPCSGKHDRVWNWESNECGHSSDVVTWENVNCNQLLAKQWIDCDYKYELLWSWSERKCASAIQTKWKDAKCSASYAKKWKREPSGCSTVGCFDATYNLEWQWKARECGSSTTQVKWKEAECSGLYAKKWMSDQLVCFEKHNLEWQWKARECGSNSTTQVKWKEAECSGLYAKKWKYEAPELVEELTEDEILLERANPVTNNDYRIQAPCVEIDFCYIALEEDGVTSIDQQEINDVFLTDCLA